MEDDQVYVLTDQGAAELRSGATTLSPRELELLVRIDGIHTVADLRHSMVADAGAFFESSLAALRRAGLVALADHDAFALQLQAEWNRLVEAEGHPEADLRLSSLRRDGYQVGFARRRITQPAADAGPLRAALVEDDPQLAGFVSALLSLHGFETTVAGCRAEVLATFRRRPVPDLILLDVTLPDVDGFDILANLRCRTSFDAVPVIMLTGHATREAVIRGLAGGADGYITKPFDLDTLETVLREVTALLPAPATAAG